MSGASLGSSLVSTSKKIAEDVISKHPSNRKAVIKNVDNIDYKLDADIDLPVGDIVLSSRAIVTPYAGDGYGFICSPRENQSVITLPVDNDHNKSVIIGRTYDIDTEKPPVHNLGDVLLRHQLGHQWSFTYTQPITGDLNLDTANQINLTLDEEESTTGQLKFFIDSPSTPIVLIGQIIRVVLDYESSDDSTIYLNVNIEWETMVEFDESSKAFIVISDANTVVGGPLYQSENTSTPKHYLMQQYQDKYFAMILSPTKGRAQFSHYMGMGIFMEEYPDRVPIGSAMRPDGRYLADGNKPKSWTLNTDSFLDDTLDEFGYLNNFPRGSIIFKHYTQSGLIIEEKVQKTYDLKDEADDWNQSAIGLDLSLIRQTPKFKNLAGLDDQEKPLASLLMEDDCKNSYYNAVHVRLAHDNTGIQRISEEEIIAFDVQHLVEDETRIENPLPGTRPSRVQFYDLKRTPTSADFADFKCFHDDESRCKLNVMPPDNENPDGKDYPEEEHQATYGSGREDPKLGKKKCPNWPGCIEGHYTHQNIDLPLAIRNTDIRVDNVDLLMKPKANAEFAHYTSSGLFFEEQLPKDESGDIDYDAVSTFHAPVIDLRLREWDYVPKSDGSTIINYASGSKNNAHEPKRYDLCNLKFETIYGIREDNYIETEDGEVTFEDKHDTYKTATKMFLGQNLYGNLLPDPDDSENVVKQNGSRLLIEDLLDDNKAPLSVWEPITSIEDPNLKPKDPEPGEDPKPDEDGDTRVIFPKGKLELMHYTNSGLLIEDQDITTATNEETDYSGVGHRMAMSLQFNYWSVDSAGDDQYRPVNSHSIDLNDKLGISDEIDPMGIMKWHETAKQGTVFPAVGDYKDDETSFVDFFIYQNALRSQHITKNSDGAITWWDGEIDGGDPENNPTGAYVAIRESDNSGTDIAPRAPVVEITDTKNSIKMDSKDGGQKVEITNRENQFTNTDAGTNKIMLDVANKLIEILNGQEGSEDNSIVLDKTNKKIVITDSNGNTITMEGGGIFIVAGDSKIDINKDGDIDIDGKTAININGKAGITITDPAVTITGGTLTVDGIAAPTGTGPFCGIPACLFSSAPHVGNKVANT